MNWSVVEIAVPVIISILSIWVAIQSRQVSKATMRSIEATNNQLSWRIGHDGYIDGRSPEEARFVFEHIFRKATATQRNHFDRGYVGLEAPESVSCRPSR